MTQASLIWITPNAEQVIAFCARVSSPNQNKPEIDGLLRYCAQNKHWSIFEMANMCIELTTTRAVSAQLIRHRSLSFQEFSTRYASAQNIIKPAARRQDTKNRQNSIDDLDAATLAWWDDRVTAHLQNAKDLYQQALDKGIAKECARMMLPLSTETRLYASGTIRSWIHYLQVRAEKASGTQLEHHALALRIKDLFIRELPIISKALDFTS